MFVQVQFLSPGKQVAQQTVLLQVHCRSSLLRRDLLYDIPHCCSYFQVDLTDKFKVSLCSHILSQQHLILCFPVCLNPQVCHKSPLQYFIYLLPICIILQEVIIFLLPEYWPGALDEKSVVFSDSLFMRQGLKYTCVLFLSILCLTLV